mgnify:CR=1 FL=1
MSSERQKYDVFENRSSSEVLFTHVHMLFHIQYREREKERERERERERKRIKIINFTVQYLILLFFFHTYKFVCAFMPCILRELILRLE